MKEQILNYTKVLDQLTKDGKTEAAILIVDIPKAGTQVYVGGTTIELKNSIVRALRYNTDLARLFLEAVNLYELSLLKDKTEEEPDKI